MDEKSKRFTAKFKRAFEGSKTRFFVLFHRADFFFDEGDFLFAQAVFFVELTVDLGDRLRPVDVGVGGEVLEWNVTPSIFFITLRNF